MKSIVSAFAAILATTATAWFTPAPFALTHSQLIEIVHNANDDPGTLKSIAGAHIVTDLRPSAIRTHFIAAGNVLGMALICQSDFGDFAGGPVAATLLSYEHGEDARDFVKLSGCTSMER